MQAYERATIYGYSIFEMQVYGIATGTLAPTPGPTESTPAPSPSPTAVTTTQPPVSIPVLNINVARGKASAASSGSAAAKAFDGNMNLRFESQHGVEDVWLQVDLGTEYAIDTVKVHWEFSAVKSYDIQVSNDGVSFATVWSKTDGVGGMGTVDSVVGGVTGRYVRMQGHERATVWGYSIWEMEVFGTMLPTPSPVRLSTGETTASSENWSSMAAAKATDGNMGTRFERVHGVEDVWLQVDLGTVYAIDHVSIYWEFSAAKSYDIQVSNDGVSFTTVWSKTDGVGGMGNVGSVVSGATGRYVRMQPYERATIYGYSIHEGGLRRPNLVFG